MQRSGILVFACIMGTLGFQVFIEGVQQLVGKEHTHHLEDLQLVIGIMIGVIVVKFFLFLYCRGSWNRSVQACGARSQERCDYEHVRFDRGYYRG